MGKKSRNPKKAAANALKRSPGTDEEARDPTWFSPHLKCEDCQSDYFAPPAMVCQFPGCAQARCGDCVSATGPVLFRCCPICKVHLCVDHGFALMTPAGPEDPMAVEHWTFGMKCESCEATREGCSPFLRCLHSIPTGVSEGPGAVAADVAGRSPVSEEEKMLPLGTPRAVRRAHLVETLDAQILKAKAEMAAEANVGVCAAPTPKPPKKKNCVICGKEGLFKCAGCTRPRYCSTECQRAHWPIHRELCKVAASLKAKEASLKAKIADSRADRAKLVAELAEADAKIAVHKARRAADLKSSL